MRSLLVFGVAILGCAAPAATVPDTAPTGDVAAGGHTKELEDERPLGDGSCCIDGVCRFGKFPGRREWTQDCRDKGGTAGQWCPGECVLDIDARPPTCGCL